MCLATLLSFIFDILKLSCRHCSTSEPYGGCVALRTHLWRQALCAHETAKHHRTGVQHPQVLRQRHARGSAQGHIQMAERQQNRSVVIGMCTLHSRGLDCYIFITLFLFVDRRRAVWKGLHMHQCGHWRTDGHEGGMCSRLYINFIYIYN